jgi:phage shock protein PspC (stress-responsive transcriptional regulator)
MAARRPARDPVSMETTESIREPHGVRGGRLTRRRADRWAGGVAAGLGDYFDLNPAVYRVAFVALALAGGTGVLLYAAAWLVIPEEGSEESLASDYLKKHRDHPRRLVGLGILAFVALVALSEARLWPSPGNLWLAVVLTLGALVWWRLGPAAPVRRRLLATTLVALVAAAAAALVLAVRIPLFAGIGDRLDRPAVVADVHSKYTLGIGELRLNLDRARLPKGQTFVKATVGIGKLRVLVPENATVDVDGHVQAGELVLFGEKQGGTHVHSHTVDRTGSGRVLVLDLHTGLGKILVERG